MARLFGTDGVRGLANADLSPELALSLAVAAAHTLPDQEDRVQPPLVVVGRDPRASGEMLEAAVVAGLASAGANVVRVGVLPTPGVAFLTAEVRADFGVMISASHNPMPDNGIKFFAAGGHKLTDEQEDAIEAALGATWTRPTGAQVGRVHDLLDGAEHYTSHLVEATGQPLAGIKVVLDCAHGAASDVAPEAFREAGAEVIAINAEPDGLNINDECGATHLAPLKAAVVAHGAHLGIAVDGDADRCLAVDASGAEVDGDQIMAILALAMRDAGALAENTLVATVMSNLGLRIAMREAGITLVETKVGDRYVLEELRAGGFSLGGEQSGHVVFTEHATTGDGVLTGLRLLARVAETGKTLAELAAVVQRLPQVLINVRVADKGVARAPEILAAVAAAEAQLAGTGRVLLRPSGTEPLVRVMVEASTEDVAQKIAEGIAADVRAASPVG
ncbi:phosphoglucosamine mutase [Catellatospora bangladeshensis]|uniref:Phosphoglucosamine mutase n=1 Tax=Catellatospora bangladeshensis TaxID=310355 RepID=A0A8J3JHX6_9ACTN|nr:phosphoglucosamine mutase [Catellatospora bangladeshensis]GIF79320.1 phosphoglucosamine mutase [Catellatospora bangladeshensis]